MSELSQSAAIALSDTESIDVGRPVRHAAIRLAIESVFRQRLAFTAIILTFLALTLTVILVKKREFESNMKFLVQASRTNAVISADRSTPNNAPPDVTEQQINSEMQLLQSQDVIGEVVDPGWSAEPVQQRSQSEIEAHDARVAAFIKHLTVEPIRKANVISVTFLAPTAEEAAATLQKLSAAYIGARKSITRPAGTSEFFAEEMRKYKEAWAHANQEMVDFQRANGIVSVPDIEAALSQQVMTAENGMRTAQANLDEATEKIKESKRLTADVPERQSTLQRLTPNLGAIQQVQSVLLQLQNRRTELLNRYQPTDRLVTELDRQIADTTATLNIMHQRRATEDSTDVNPAWQQIRNGAVQSSIDRRASQSRIRSLQHDLVSLHAQLARIQALKLRYNELQEQVDQTRNNFEILSEKRDQSGIEDAMDERKLVNIAVAQSPTVNYRQVAPRPLQYFALGTLTAIFLAASAVYLLESWRNTIATPRELDASCHYPVLATVPFSNTSGSTEPTNVFATGVYHQFSGAGRSLGDLSPVAQKVADIHNL